MLSVSDAGLWLRHLKEIEYRRRKRYDRKIYGICFINN